MAKDTQTVAPESNEDQQFAIQRIYTKDISYESPTSPKIFQTEWEPELHLDIQTNTESLGEDNHNVVLTLTVTVKNEKDTAFLVEVKQAGIFTIKGFPEDQLKHTLGSFCPSVLYPYAREVVTNLVTKGGFPQLVLAPVNFDALYSQHLAEQKTESAETTH